MLGFVRQTQVIKFTGTLGRQHSRYLWKPLFFQKKMIFFQEMGKSFNWYTVFSIILSVYRSTREGGREKG